LLSRLYLFLVEANMFNLHWLYTYCIFLKRYILYNIAYVDHQCRTNPRGIRKIPDGPWALWILWDTYNLLSPYTRGDRHGNMIRAWIMQYVDWKDRIRNCRAIVIDRKLCIKLENLIIIKWIGILKMSKISVVVSRHYGLLPIIIIIYYFILLILNIVSRTQTS